MSDDAQPGDPRVFLAIERTFLAWTRTALALMGFGFVVARLGLFFREVAVTQPNAAPAGSVQTEAAASLLLGCGLILIGVAIQLAAIVEHRQRVRSFRAARPIAPMRDAFATIVGVCILAVGSAAAAYLILRMTN